ncbi:MAG: hypothetical protein ACLQUY_12485 [Ktedonobacterales bacterium]
MTKVIEILFRNKWRLLLLLFLPILVSLAVVTKLPRQYQASAGLWALRRYEIIGATGPESDLTSTPAQTQATTLTELLQSRSFALAVASDTNLPKMLAPSNHGTQKLHDALYTEISTNVMATPEGYNLLEITYTNTNPDVALQVVREVVSHYGTVSSSQSTAEGNKLLATYQNQLQAAQQQAQQAAKTAEHYVRVHQLTVQQAQIDPEFQLLNALVTEDNVVVGTIQGEINTIQQQLAELDIGSTGLYTVIDSPTVPSQPVARTKSYLFGAGIGLAVGLLAAVGYFLMLARWDQSYYSPADVFLSTSYPVVVQIPQIPLRQAVTGLSAARKPPPEEVVPEEVVPEEVVPDKVAPEEVVLEEVVPEEILLEEPPSDKVAPEESLLEKSEKSEEPLPVNLPSAEEVTAGEVPSHESHIEARSI